ncbi:gap junction alpha-4 protein [Aplochiton taeniatus]
MSRADWSFLEHLLEEGQEYSTGVGRVWLTVLFLFRMLVLGAAAESAWDDEQADFVCNTRQPGCTSVCYDKAFPISHYRFFVLHVIFVSTPTIFYFGYVAVRAGREKEQRDKEEEEERRKEGGGEVSGEGGQEDQRVAVTKGMEEEGKEEGRKGKKVAKEFAAAPKLKGRLLCAYALSILLKVLLEVGFMAGLWLLYDGFVIPAKFECVRDPCPHTVDCFVSRPTEKTIFTIYTQVVAVISLLLNLVELLHLIQLAISHRLHKRYASQARELLPGSKRGGSSGEEAPGLEMVPVPSYQESSHLHLPVGNEVSDYPKPCESYVDLGTEVNWGAREAGAELLPSYLNCMGGMRTTHSPRAHQKSHKPSNKKQGKSAHKGHSGQKHYV